MHFVGLSTIINNFVYCGTKALAGQGLLILEASRSHSIGLLWTSDHPVAEIYT
jgi:hypothetical protein